MSGVLLICRITVKKVVTNCDISNRIKIHEVGTSVLVRSTQCQQAE